MLDYEYLVMDEDGNGDRGVEKWNANYPPRCYPLN